MRHHLRKCLFLILAIAFSDCSRREDKPVGEVPLLTGLDGRAFHQPDLSPVTKARLDSNLLVAQKNLQDDRSEENYIWLGRREAYLFHYDKTIETFSSGLQLFPESYRLYRHRGHRYITIRDFEKAISDLQNAADLMPEDPLETEPDGAPNSLNIPLSTTQFNVWYHLGLAHYLKGDFENALKAYDRCMDASVNDDLICATADWRYMTLRRLNRKAEAEKILDKISDDMKIIENDSYHKRLLMYKGILPVDSVLNVGRSNHDVDLALATQGYDVGNWYLYNGDSAKAIEVFQKVVGGKHFSAFGFIAAEAELARFGN